MSLGNPNPSPENRFKPGQSGNPKGKPKGARSLTKILREIVEANARSVFGDKVPDDMKDKTCGELLMLKLVAMGIKDDRMAIGDITDRLDGKPLQSKKIDANVRSIEIVDVGGIVGKDESDENIQGEPEGNE